MIHPLVLLVLALAVARITKVVVDDKITFPIRRFVLNKFGEENWLTTLIHCIDCTSFWIGGLGALYSAISLGLSWWLMPIVWFALSQVTIILDRMVR